MESDRCLRLLRTTAALVVAIAQLGAAAAATPAAAAEKLAATGVAAIQGRTTPALASSPEQASSYYPLSGSTCGAPYAPIVVNYGIANTPSNDVVPTISSGFVGTVSLPDGSPASGGFVQARPGTMGVPPQGGPIDQSGRFQISGLLTGTVYYLVAQPISSTQFTQSMPREAEFEGDLKSFDLRFTLPQFAGVVLDGGVPTGSAAVNIFPVGVTNPAGKDQRAPTNNLGQFRFGGIPDGQYVVVARSTVTSTAPSVNRGLTVNGGVVAVFADQPYVGPVTISLPSVQLSGYVKIPNGTTVRDSWISLRRTDFAFGTDTQSAPDGTFAFGGVPDGQYDLVAHGTGIDSNGGFGGSLPPLGNSLPARITFSGGVASPSQVALVLTAPQIAGKVVLPNGSGIPGSQVMVFPESSTSQPLPMAASASTDPSGRFSVSGLANGSYRLFAKLPPNVPYRSPAPVVVVVQTGSPVIVTLQARTTSKVLKGKVFLEGTPAKYAMVFANKQDGSGHSDARVDSTGAYTMFLSSGGSWMVGVAPATGPEGGVPDWVYGQPPQNVSFASDETSELQTLDFNVSRAGATIAGRVLRNDGSPPLPFSVHVDVRDDSGRGNGGPVGQDGSFRIAVSPGRYSVRVSSNDPTLGQNGPPPVVEAIEDGTTTVPDIILSARTLTIGGRVTVYTGSDIQTFSTGVAGVEVTAWRSDGGDFVRTTSVTDGLYSLFVTPGVWFVQARPSPGSDYAPYGAPRQVKVESTSLNNTNVEVIAAGGKIKGRLVSTAAGVDPTRVYGFAFALDARYRQVGGVPIEAGGFTLNVPTGMTFTVGVGFPPGFDFGAQPRVADLRTTSVVTIEIPIQVVDSNIVGQFVDGSGNPVSNLSAEAFAFGDGGQRSAKVDSTGRFTIRVLGGDWRLGAHLGPASAESYILEIPSNNRVTVPAGGTVVLPASQNFVVRSASGVVSGTVFAPDGQPLRGAYIWAEQPSKAGGPPKMVAGTASDSSGKYRLRLPTGEFSIRAGAAPALGHMPPAPVTVQVGTSPVALDINFREAAARIKGSVVFTGTEEVFVTGYSSGGASSFTRASSTGSFTLSVTANDTWFLRAVSREGSVVYRSQEVSATVGTADVTGVQLQLVAGSTLLPDGASITFDASEMKILRLSDGTQVTIPANALAISGTVTVVALPKTDLPSQPSQQPVDFGYALVAKDANNVEIKQFQQKVTIVLPYPKDDVLASLGISEQSLVPMYWDNTAGAWKPADNVTPDFEHNTMTISTDHFTDFAVLTTSRSGTAGSYTVVVPVAANRYSKGW